MTTSNQTMKIKNYRAASLREALVQIKEELGDDALVLETKQVRAGGFLGVGGRNLIEVRVAPNPSSKAKTNKSQTSKLKAGQTKVSLRDDTEAAPKRARSASAREDADATSSPTYAALVARTYSGKRNTQAADAKLNTEEDTQEELIRLVQAAASRNKQLPNANPGRSQEQGVELAETAPRIVHRQQANGPLVNNQEPEAQDQDWRASSRPAYPSSTVSIELARMRAELRELKFALGAFAPQPASRGEMNALAAFETHPIIYDSPYYETYVALTASGLPAELAHEAAQKIIPGGTASRDARADAFAALVEALPSWVRFAEAPLAIQAAAVFVGPTGVGKTTTIAKLAARIALRARQRVELITLDTYRIAAVHQLKTYAEIIGAGCHIAHSVVELDAMVRRFTGQATVLIDTTGRSPHDLADQMELADYLRGNEALAKCLVLPATTHRADAQLAFNKFALYGVNRLVLTKLDETVQPGSAVGIAALSSLPLVYLCAGQRVPEDLERATPRSFAARVVRPGAPADAA
jgi:flagellar biosynthesis protein FlhF